MNGNCHFVFGAAVGTSICLNLNYISGIYPNISNTNEMATLFILGGVIGGIFPDIDNPTSYMGKLTVPVSTVIGEIGRAKGKTKQNHRGILHDPILYIVSIILAYKYFTPLIGFFVGCLSHIFLDMFNPAGVPILLKGSRIRLAKMASGSKSSVVFTWVCVVVTVALGIVLKYRKFV